MIIWNCQTKHHLFIKTTAHQSTLLFAQGPGVSEVCDTDSEYKILGQDSRNNKLYQYVHVLCEKGGRGGQRVVLTGNIFKFFT